MEFSYAVSEDDFLKAVRLRCRKSVPLGKIILFWVFVLICLLLLWGAMSRDTRSQTTEEPAAGSSSSGRTWLPITVISAGLVVVLQFTYWGPRSLRQNYRKNPAMQGRFTVDITPESIGMTSTAEFTSHSKWNLYEFWREKEHLIVLVLLSGLFVILNVADLTESQRAELRGILSSAIPRK